jgi:hypothetical protein
MATSASQPYLKTVCRASEDRETAVMQLTLIYSGVADSENFTFHR